MAGWLDGPVLSVLQKGLDASGLRHQVLSNNVANVDTPNFKRSEVDFQTLLNTALGQKSGVLPMKQTVPKHLHGLRESASGVMIDPTTSLRNDGNNVDIDREMTNVAMNGIYYNSLTRAISSQLGLLKMVVK